MVELWPMTTEELDAFRRVSLGAYVDQRVEFGGEKRDDATRTATAQYQQFFPAGRPAGGHHLFTGRDGVGGRIGVLWLFRRSPDSVWIHDIEVDPAVRGRGFGRGLMLAAQRWAGVQGATVIELNVFGGNEVARRLYTALGYTERAVHMTKPL